MSAILGAAWAADADVQRQLQIRDQMQRELQLKMQQQNERAGQPPPQAPAAVVRERSADRNQQQRLQQLHDQQLRATIPPALETARESDRLRADQRGAEELNRMGIDRRYESAREPAAR